MRWLWGALVTSAVALSTSGCGSSGSGGAFGGGNNGGGIDAAAPFDATSPGQLLPPGGDEGGTEEGGGGGPQCTPRTCIQAGTNCGPVADGCGGLLDCGDLCPVGQSCGGGGTPSVCGGPTVTCTPLTCADSSVANLCGQQSDGCGGLIPAPCVTCTGTETCGGGGTPNQCGGKAGCVAATTTTLCSPGDGGIPYNCGLFGDGCGGLVSCSADSDAGTCLTAGESCGGSGLPNVCGSPTITPLPDGGTVTSEAGLPPPVCTPIPYGTACNPSGTQALCGPQTNGCGGTWTCTVSDGGPVCNTGDSCGGGGTPSVCGHATCTPAPVCTVGGVPICGSVSDGCGSTYVCPTTCSSPDTCGGDPSAPGTCGTPPCTAITSCPSPYNCGSWPNGCGGTIECGTLDAGSCPAGEFCGGGGFSECGTGTGAGFACDAGLKCDLNSCDGGTTTTLRGTIFDPAVAGATLSSSWPTWKTTAGNPLYNVVVYVPNSAPSTLTHGQPSCDSCSLLFTGDPIVATTTDTDGNFTLTNVPVPTSSTTGPWGTLTAGEVPIVIQIGKWRREWVWPGVTSCAVNTATAAQETSFLHLPGSESTSTPTTAKTNDDLPQIAVSTGSADSMECLFSRIGFASSEYACGWNAGSGHLHVFQGGETNCNGTNCTSTQGNGYSGCSEQSSASLWDSKTDLYNYDILILSCEGEEALNANPTVLQEFSTAGGRAFASHFHYSWFTGAPLDNSYGVSENPDGNSYSAPTAWGNNLATWYPGANYVCADTVGATTCEDNGSDEQVNTKIVETLSDGGTPFYTWMSNVGALGTGGAPAGELHISEPRANAAVASSITADQVWIVPDSLSSYEYIDQGGSKNTPLPTNSTQYFSFNTPIGGTGDAGAEYCGRVVYSDLHVGAAAGDYGGSTKTVPGGCASSALTPQEKALEYMLLDLSSCVSSDTNLPVFTCTPTTTCPAGTCGTIANGCGGSLDCGGCDGGACIDNVCQSCTPITTCPNNDAGVERCGDWPNGCGGTLTCASCPSGSVCSDGVCITGCTPAKACPGSTTCGVASDGCGGTIACGPLDGGCSSGTTCGGGGTPGSCGEGDANACVPQACPSSLQCGLTGNGCGGTVDCGDCKPPATCGGGGTPGVCGSPNCTPATCASLGANCGQVADGCGGLTPSCGTCTGSATCGGGGTTNVCGVPPCTPETCAQLGLNCGEIGDGCGSTLTCGTCNAPDTCGGGGQSNICGTGGVK